MLDSWGVHHEVVVPQVEETFEPGTAAGPMARLLAREKALHVRDRVGPGRVILAADTIVDHQGHHLAKPSSAQEAERMLMSVAGSEVEVVTGVCVLGASGVVGTGHEVSRVLMRPPDLASIRAYVATGEVHDKAGAFAVQGLGRDYVVERVEGSLTNVIGLPRRLTLDLLETVGGVMADDMGVEGE